VTEGDVDLLRRVLYAYGGDGGIGVTQPEAEVLFDIDAATADADNHPSWRDLFVKAIANCVMSSSGYAAPAREIALARDAWLDRRGDLALGSIVSGMGTGMKNFLTGYRKQTSEERAITRLTQQKIEIVTNEGVTVAEAAWLAERIGRDGRLTPNEQALLMFLKSRQRVDPSAWCAYLAARASTRTAAPSQISADQARARRWLQSDRAFAMPAE
jgi:hypothetical protein